MNSPEAIAAARLRCLELMAAFNAGQMNLDRALDAIVETWTGEADRIVRVGEAPQPEIKS